MYQRNRILLVILLSIFQHKGANAFVSSSVLRSSHHAQSHSPPAISPANIIASIPTRTDSASLFLQAAHKDERPESSLLRRLTPAQRKKEWNNRSLKYYASVRRLEKSGIDSEVGDDNLEHDKDLLQEAHLHYYALTKIRDNSYRHAEVIYRISIEKKMRQREEEGVCDHAALAVSTLLLALHLQRQGKDSETIKKTRSVFLRFFRIVGQDDVQTCSCSAKVLQAYALFEMKRGFSRKSLELLKQAVAMDENLKPVLGWKQFRDIEDELKSRVNARKAARIAGGK